MTVEMKGRAKDIDIDRLVPLQERQLNFRANTGFRKILASISEIGIIEPLCVYEEGGMYIILDGYIRYRSCLELGVETVPCLVFPDKEAYTFNRMVNQLSYTQEARMLRKSLESVDEQVIARVFGQKSIKHKLDTSLQKRLDPKIVAALDKGLITKCCAKEFTYVKPERQLQILKEMQDAGDYAVSFARALVLRTPAKLRNKEKKRHSPWDKDPAQKQQLVAKLEAVEKRYDFYSSLYRQYSSDLLKLCFYVRKLVTNKKIHDHMETSAPEILQRFETILFETQGEQKEGVSTG